MFFNKISFRIGVWYGVAFLVSALLLFILTSILLIRSLQSKDRFLLENKIREFSSIYSRDGINGLKLKTISQNNEDNHRYVVKLSDHLGKTLFIYSPDRSDDHDAPSVKEIDNELQSAIGKNIWMVIHGDDYGDNLEFVSKVLSSGETLQVGKDLEDREEFLESFSQAYLLGLLPIFFLAIGIGRSISIRLLKPIRLLTQTVESIRAGNPQARVDLHTTKDELWHLGYLFNQMLEQNEKLIKGMQDTLDNVAHDLRTPVMRIQNSIEAALQGKQEHNLLKEALINCQENTEMLIQLVNGIMDISEANAGTLPLKRENLHASEIIEAVIDLYAFVAEEKNITLVAKMESMFKFTGDRVRIIQALSNLLDNAIKYSPSQTTIVIKTTIEDKMGIINVIDQGIGISETEKNKIWDRLYRADTSRSSRGLGLGLSLVKAIIHAHDGQVSVHDNEEKGTTFSLKLKRIDFIEQKEIIL